MADENRTRLNVQGGLGFGALALALGCVFAYPRQWTRGFLINDEAWYAEPARHLASGRGFVTDTLYPMYAGGVTAMPVPESIKQIGYPLLCAMIARVTGLSDQLFLAVALAGFALTGTATWLAVLAITKRPLVAAAITLATIGNPVFWEFWTAALPETIFTALFLGSVWLLVAESGPARVWAGVLLATSLYFKGFAVLYVPVATLFLLAGPGRARYRHTAAFLAGVVATMAMGTAVLPSGTGQYSGSSRTFAGSLLLYETPGAYPRPEGPLYDVTPIDAYSYILQHPLDYGEKVARMVSRTKGMVETLGGPALGGMFFPVLLLAAASLMLDAGSRARRRLTGTLPQPAEGSPGTVATGLFRTRMLIGGLVAINFAFFWAGNFKMRYFAHLFPLMLAAVFLEFDRLVPSAWNWWRSTRPGWLGVAAIAYFLIYPPLVGLWSGYRDPYAYLGGMLAVRWADYGEVADTVRTHVEPEAMVMSDMAHEISWYTERPTVFFPGEADQFDYLVDRYNVRALYEHPRLPRDWPVLTERFQLVDERNGRFWVRRD